LCNRGYAFINLVSEEAASRFSTLMHAFTFPDSKSVKSVRVSIAKYQGVKANLERCQSVFYGGLLYYPWVLADGEMKCLFSKDQVAEYAKSHMDNADNASVSTETSTVVGDTITSDSALPSDCCP
jgi:hypothetical protein